MRGFGKSWVVGTAEMEIEFGWEDEPQRRPERRPEWPGEAAG